MKNFPIKPIVYGEMTCDILAGEDFDYFPEKYLVVSYGTHPCCYVGIPNGVAINTNDILCHGGITFTASELPCYLMETHGEELKDFSKDTWWIGWDYAHCGDWVFVPHRKPIKPIKGCCAEKEWTTEELISDCKNVMAQVMELRQKNL